MSVRAAFQRSKVFRFAAGAAAAAASCGAAYLVIDALSDVVTMRECQRMVLPLAAQHQALAHELQPPIAAGPMWRASLRSSPSGGLVQCRFTLDGVQRSAAVTATVQRPACATPLLYNLTGPGTWQLVNCHVLVGAVSSCRWMCCI